TPIYGNLASVYGLNGIPSMIIDRFEVIKGPSSTLYGSEAVAGVINIITKNPATQPLASIDVMGTSHLESFGNFSFAPKIGKSAGFLGVNYAYINDFDDENGDGFGDNVNLDRVSFFSKWDISRRSGRKFSLAGKYYYEDRRNGVEDYLTDRNYQTLRGSDEVYGESIYTHRLELFGSYEFVQNLKLDFSGSTHRQDSYYGVDQYRASQDILFSNLIWNNDFKNHDLTIGLTNRYQIYDDNTIATESNGSSQPDRQYIPGVFVQDEWELSNSLTVLGGARLDQYENHGVIFSPRLSSKLKIKEWTTVRTNFGTGFRIVNLFTEDHAFVTGQREVVIAETLRPEESYNLSVNLNHVFVLGGSQGMIDIDAYYTHFSNKITPDYDTSPDQIIYENTSGYAVSRGIGINLQQEFSFPLAANFGFNIQDVFEREQNQTIKIQFAPKWSGVLTANYKFDEANLTLSLTSRLTGSMPLPLVYDLDDNGNQVTSPRPTKSAAFAIHNFQVNHDMKKGLSVYGGIQNLFNYTQPWSPLVAFNDPNSSPGFSDRFDTSYAYSPIHGREFYLGVRWTADLR
ncbi:MAG: TonB-dependent receptor, partial [Cyclobacteriaceae bacterium]